MSAISGAVRSLIEDMDAEARPELDLVPIKGRVLKALNTVLQLEADLFEEHAEEMTLEDATNKASDLLKFYRFVNGINNVDF